MINADEHKKLLAQIEELEKNSVNYFDVEKEFFLITSDNLADVQTRLYGYSIQRSGIYEDDNLTPEAIAGLDGRGCYVYVENKDGKITIKQDLNGCWGIYLFRHGDYFALSNSFFRLLDHVKFRYPLTVNRDYCNYLLVNDLCSHAHLETAANEIQLVERNAVFHIDVAGKNLEINLSNYKEYTVSPNSETGIAILDCWVDFWSDVLRGVAQHTKFIQADLSGGFDSRISFLLLLHSGIDYNKIKIWSSKSTAHTYAEDYDIASKIAECYGLKLNKPLPEKRNLTYSFTDVFNLNLYHRQTFHKVPELYLAKKSVEKTYILNGYAGETIRRYWLVFGSFESFIRAQIGETKKYSSNLSHELSDSVKNMLNSARRAISDKYKIKDQNSGYIQQYLYQETRCRSHFGKISLGRYFTNTVMISPILDPELRTLQTNTSECLDPDLLMALIFVRYEPDLLNFPFNGKRSIAPETIEYAKKINERFPRRVKDNISDVGGGVFSSAAA